MSNNKHYYNTVIIGAGPAGLFAAYRLAKGNYAGSIALIDKGKPANSRIRSVHTSSDDMIFGVGGAGLFSDGKLCLDYNIGNKLNDLDNQGRLSSYYSYFNTELHDLLGKSCVKDKQLSINADELFQLTSKCSSLGLDYKYYPVLHLGSDRYHDFINKFIQRIKPSCDFYTENNALQFEKSNGRFSIFVQNCQKYHIFECDNLILAPGKNGANWLYRMAEDVGIKTEYNPVYVGLRIETAKNEDNALTKLSDDPKIHMFLDGQHMKTHCFCEGGYVVAVDYNGYKTISGHSFSQRKSKNTNFNVLLKTNSENVEHKVVDLLSTTSIQGNCKPLLQRLGDFRKSQDTIKSDIDGNTISPTLNHYCLGDLNKSFSKDYRKMFLVFINKLNELYPGVNQDSTLLYAPVVEWCSRRVKVDEYMQTDIENLFVCGDGSGWTQGIVAASVSGIIPGEAVLRRK